MSDASPSRRTEKMPGGTSAVNVGKPSLELPKLQGLYDRNLFLQAFQETAGYWNPEVPLDAMSTAELVLALRLAARLGGSRLSRWLARMLMERDGDNPVVRYYTSHIRQPGWRLFDDFRAMESDPELAGADADTQASWLAYSAVRWASIRDFERAHNCIERARFWKKKDAWVLSCESDVFSMQDRGADALASAELSWEIAPGTPFAARSLAGSLLNLRRVQEAAERLDAAAEHSESFELPMLACWYLCALAETCVGEERTRLLRRATELANRMPVLAPLADRETHRAFARTHLDIAQLSDDHSGIERWAKEARSPFHRRMLENLHGDPAGVRIRLPFRHAVQKHNECLPTSIGSAMAAMGVDIDADAMAAEITFGGTLEWASADWLEKRGLQVRFFVATPEVSARLIKAGFAFVITLESDTSAHAVAIVGLDEATGTVLVHDPQSFRSNEYLLDALGKDEAPLGPRAMIATTLERAPLLDQLLLNADAETTRAREMRRRAGALYGPAEARKVVAKLATQHPLHPVTRLLQALQNHEDGHVGTALAQFQNLLRDFPGSAFVRSNLISCCRSLGNMALMRETLAEVVERGILPGMQTEQEWAYPPSVYVTEYADLLRGSASTRDKSRHLLHALIGRNGAYGPAWHVLADLLWSERDTDGALLGYRISAYLDDKNEHYAQSYCNALGRVGRDEDGLEWLAQRVRRFGSSSHAVTTWVTWINALERWGRPERALAAAQESLHQHGHSAELLVFLVPFFARMGKWAEAEQRLTQLERTGNTLLFRQASVAFYRMRGELTKAIDTAEAWSREAPLSMGARQELLDLLAHRDGAPSAIKQARNWLAEHPAHDEMEALYCHQLDRISYLSWHKYSVMLRRVKRNPEDGWAWRELAFCAMYDFERAGERRQKRLTPRIVHFLDRCNCIAPGDAATLRAWAQWSETRGEWSQAVDQWLEAIDRDPANIYAYRRAWDCASRLDHAQRHAVWMRIETALLREPGHSPVAREMLALAAGRFGVIAAEEAASRWGNVRPDDPEVVKAHVDLLLNHGHGRTDCERALQLVLGGLQRFPFQIALRFSQASALRKLGRFQEAEEVLDEMIRRHPDNSSAQVQLAWVHHHHGRTEQALRGLEAASTSNPRDLRLPQAQVEILIDAKRLPEARDMIGRLTHKFPAEVGWRESAIKLLRRCGDDEGAIQTARDGVIAHPREAYLWMLLGRSLYEMRRFAAQGEIESSLTRSLTLNAGLYEAADYLTMLRVEQRRLEDAEAAILPLERRLDDPSPARGRTAWIHRQQDRKREALDELISVVRQAPWYEWGWNVLLDWIVEDKSWDHARSLLTQAPPELRTNTRFHQRRLEALQRAGLPAEQLDAEWNNLLHDFPEDMSLHLLRYDSLRDSNRYSEAVEVLSAIRTVYPDSLFVKARWAEVLARDQKKEEAIACLMEILFSETEPSTWPADFAWNAVEKSQYEEDAYLKARSQLAQGGRPTEHAISILAGYAMARGGFVKRGPRHLLRTWFPGPGGREVLELLKIIKANPRRQEIRLSGLLRALSDFGYQRIVARYWRSNKDEVERDIGTWSETIQALTTLRHEREVLTLVADWRERVGVTMSDITNYVICLSGVSSQQLREVRASCRDALAGLPHNHCARYLAFRLAESCALLGDEDGFRDTWKRCHAYLERRLEAHEFFPVKQRYLLADIRAMARLFENNQLRQYRRKVWGLRRQRFSLKLRFRILDRQISVSWWWLLWIVFLILIQILSRSS
jgi:predicted Zn-dependent protease